MTKKITSIYRSKKEEGLYLYVDKKEGIERVPETLLKRFGQQELAMTIVIEPGKKLARANAEKVIQAIDETGYYLQLPPTSADYMQEINKENSKLYSHKSDHDY